MLIDFSLIETDGRDLIVEGLDRSDALHYLSAALDDTEVHAVVLDLSEIEDGELKTAAGLFYGLGCSLDLRTLLKTFQFCFTLFEELMAEIKRRGLEYTVH